MRTIAVLFAAALAVAATSLNFVHEGDLVTGGGAEAVSPGFTNRSTVGQPVTGVSSSPSFILVAGFEPMVSTGGAGTVISSDGFATLDAWTPVGGSWAAAGGILVASGGGALRSNGPTTANAWIEFKVRFGSPPPVVSLVFRAQDPTLDGNNQYWVELDPEAGQARLLKDVAGVESVVGSTAATLASGVWTTVRVKFAADDMRVLIDGTPRLSLSDSSLSASGYYGLRVTGGGTAEFDDWSVVTAANSIPEANAGPDQTVDAGAQVLLNGMGSTDGDGDPLNFLWTQTSGPPVALSNPTSAAPSFTAVGGAVATFSLVVDDGLNTGAADTVTVTANPAPAGGGGRKGGGGGCGLTGLEALLALLLFRRTRGRSRGNRPLSRAGSGAPGGGREGPAPSTGGR